MADRPLRSAPRMTGAEALMWAVERDAALRSTFCNITLLDREADAAEFRRRIARAVVLIPRLRQRVVVPNLPVVAPAWEDDPGFDLDYHVRRVALPRPGSLRQLLDLAELDERERFDPDRPPWRFTLVEGLDGGRGALVAKMHHAISDGVGAIRLSALFTDIERDPPDPGVPEVPPVLADDEPPPDLGGRLAEAGRWAARQVADRVTRRVTDPLSIARDAGEAVEVARALARQLAGGEQARSPLWTGKRSTTRRFETLSVPLEPAKTAAKALGGTLNDLYVAAVAGGAGAYHRAKGAPVDELRMTMPVSTRSDRSMGGNAFAPARVTVPTVTDPVVRFVGAREALDPVKRDRALGMIDTLASAALALPQPALLRLVRQQVATVDFAASNTRGAPFDLFISGARVEANHPMGPTGGTAFNVTLMSYCGALDMGLSVDPAAVEDPALLRDSIAASFAEVVAAGT